LRVASSHQTVATISTVPDVAGRSAPMSMQRFLMERELGQDICQWVAPRRKQGMSWGAIAREMNATLRLPPKAEVTQVTRQLLQKWCRGVVE
jgi:hypothetical protein